MATVKPNILDGNEMRPMTDAEYAQWQADNKAHATQAEAQAVKNAARQAVLDKLGLTTDEAQTLFG